MIALRNITNTARTKLPRDDPDTLFNEESLGASIYEEVIMHCRLLSNQVGIMERIMTTPMTFGYVATLRFFLILWLATLPIALIGAYGWMAPVILAGISFLFLIIEQMAIEIEQPFGDDANDLPIESYIIDVEKVMLEMRSYEDPPPEPDIFPSTATDATATAATATAARTSPAADDTAYTSDDGAVGQSFVRRARPRCIKPSSIKSADPNGAASRSPSPPPDRQKLSAPVPAVGSAVGSVLGRAGLPRDLGVRDVASLGGECFARSPYRAEKRFVGGASREHTARGKAPAAAGPTTSLLVTDAMAQYQEILTQADTDIERIKQRSDRVPPSNPPSTRPPPVAAPSP